MENEHHIQPATFQNKARGPSSRLTIVEARDKTMAHSEKRDKRLYVQSEATWKPAVKRK